MRAESELRSHGRSCIAGVGVESEMGGPLTICWGQLNKEVQIECNEGEGGVTNKTVHVVTCCLQMFSSSCHGLEGDCGHVICGF